MRRRDALPDPEVVHGLRELEAALAAEPTADPDLAVLIADVDAVRPEPSATFLASLDARVHAGFPREDDAPRRAPAWPPWHVRLRRPQLLVPSVGGALAAGLVVLVLAGGHDRTSGDNASSSSRGAAAGAGSSVAATAPQPRPAVQTASGTTNAKAAQALPPTGAAASPRKVQRAAELTLTPAPADVQDTADGVVRETQAA